MYGVVDGARGLFPGWNRGVPFEGEMGTSFAWLHGDTDMRRKLAHTQGRIGVLGLCRDLPWLLFGVGGDVWCMGEGSGCSLHGLT